MRSLVYTVYNMNTLPIFETFSYAVAQKMKARGYKITSRLVTRRIPLTKEENERVIRRSKKLRSVGT